MKKLALVFIFVISLFFFSCKRENSLVYSESPINLENIDAKFVQDIPYDTLANTKFDIFLPESNKATGLVIYIHGGGFTSGDKTVIYKNQGYSGDYPNHIRHFLKDGIAVASINYSLINANDTLGVIKCLKDIKHALQYIRYRSNDFNIKKENIVLTGVSAGAGAALWLDVKDDMRDLKDDNPVFHESTRVKGVALIQTQCTYDLEQWIPFVFSDYGVTWDQFFQPFQSLIFGFYGIKTIEEYNSSRIREYRHDVDMLSFFSSDDPEIYADNTQSPVTPPTNISVAEHHAFHVRAIKVAADKAGIKNVCYYGKNPVIYSDPSNETYEDFIKRKINE